MTYIIFNLLMSKLYRHKQDILNKISQIAAKEITGEILKYELLTIDILEKDFAEIDYLIFGRFTLLSIILLVYLEPPLIIIMMSILFFLTISFLYSLSRKEVTDLIINKYKEIEITREENDSFYTLISNNYVYVASNSANMYLIGIFIKQLNMIN